LRHVQVPARVASESSVATADGSRPPTWRVAKTGPIEQLTPDEFYYSAKVTIT